tara:strand:+ start:15 stop:158 length:144 start_codon:yes stop_codon:yes gene_type:complete
MRSQPRQSVTHQQNFAIHKHSFGGNSISDGLDERLFDFLEDLGCWCW